MIENNKEKVVKIILSIITPIIFSWFFILFFQCIFDLFSESILVVLYSMCFPISFIILIISAYFTAIWNNFFIDKNRKSKLLFYCFFIFANLYIAFIAGLIFGYKDKDIRIMKHITPTATVDFADLVDMIFLVISFIIAFFTAFFSILLLLFNNIIRNNRPFKRRYYFMYSFLSLIITIFITKSFSFFNSYAYKEILKRLF